MDDSSPRSSWWARLFGRGAGPAHPRRFAKVPSSPCINVCRFASSGDYCIGCRMTRAEIDGWARMTAQQQDELRRRLATRRNGGGEW